MSEQTGQAQDHAIVQPIVEPLESRVLFYLREEFEDDPSNGMKDTKEIAEAMEVSIKELYDHDYDTGALFILKERGDVRRYGSEKTGWAWMADGASIVWR